MPGYQDKKAKFPKKLQTKFENRRFFSVDPPEFLDHENAEVVFIGAREDAEKELDITFDTEKETENTAEIFRELHIDKKEFPLKPLFEGKWE